MADTSEERAPEGEDAEKRRHPRAPLQLLVQYRFGSVGDFLAEYSSNISLGGIYIVTDQPREEGALIYLQFTLRNGSSLIEGLGRVVRVNRPGELAPGVQPGMGVEFVNFDDESMALIEQIVNDRLAKAGRRP